MSKRMPPPRKISHSCSAGTLPTFSQLHMGGDGLLLVPPPARPHATHQGHAHIIHNKGFLRVWVEVRGSGLHVFPHEAASLPSIVVAHLEQCDVTLSYRDTSPSYFVMISLQDKEQLKLFFETEEEAESWANMLRVTTVNRSLALEGLNLECGGADYPSPSLGGSDKDTIKSSSLEIIEGVNEEVGVNEEEEEEEEIIDHEEEAEEEGGDEFAMEALDTFLGLLHPHYCADDDTASGDSCETEGQDDDGDVRTTDGTDSKTYVRLRHPKRTAPLKPKDEAGRRELLQQMLATKSLLEKKQKNRKSGAGAWAVTAGEVVNEYDRAQHEAQQLALRKAVLLRQRKNSTAIKMATLERQQLSNKQEEGDVSSQLEALRKRLTSLDSELKESKQDTDRKMQDLEERRNQELHLIKDLGGVEDGGLEDGLVGVSKGGGGSEESGSQRGSLGGSLRGSLSSIPSIVISSSEKKTPERIFGFKVGNREGGKLKGRNPLHFLDIKLRVSRRHKSTECLSSVPDHNVDRSHSSTPGNISCSENSSDDEIDHHHHHSHHPNPSNHHHSSHNSLIGHHNHNHHHHHHQHGSDHHHHHPVKTEISREALQEIDAFKQLIDRYFETHPRHDSITTRPSRPQEIIL